MRKDLPGQTLILAVYLDLIGLGRWLPCSCFIPSNGGDWMALGSRSAQLFRFSRLNNSLPLGTRHIRRDVCLLADVARCWLSPHLTRGSQPSGMYPFVNWGAWLDKVQVCLLGVQPKGVAPPRLESPVFYRQSILHTHPSHRDMRHLLIQSKQIGTMDGVEGTAFKRLINLSIPPVSGGFLGLRTICS